MKFHIAILLILISIFSYGQNANTDSLIQVLESTTDKVQKAKISLQAAKQFEQINLNSSKDYAEIALQNSESDSLLAEANNQLGRIMFFMAELDSAIYYFNNAKELLKKLNDQKSIAIINISLGAVQLRQGDYNGTIKTLTESAAYFEEIGDILNAAKCYSNISSALAELENFEQAIVYNKRALTVFESQNLLSFQLITLPNLAAQYYKNGDTLMAIDYNLAAEKLATNAGDKRSLSIIYNNLGSIYLDTDPLKAKNYLEKTIQLKNELNLKSGIEVALGNLGYLSIKNGDYKAGISYYKQVAEMVKGKQLVFAYNQLKDCYINLNQPKIALEYAEKAQFLNDSLLNAENQKIFTEIQTKYETEKKEKEIFELQTKNLEVEFKKNRNRNLLFIVLGILAVTIFIVYILLKSSKRKRIVAEQNLKIKQQEITQILKNQELNGIDTIISAQEEERRRIADDLHDNLGSKIATLKLYIEEIKTQKSNTKGKKELLEKLKLLADDAYVEVRKIAHNKNFGALINKGLIPSIKSIAKEISISEKLKIDVININVNKRIKNNIEIQVFRSVQELLTNIIKHADATEATIQFSEDDNRLNIMVEDNGKGFNIKDIKLGLGLTNIEKRIENIDGNIIIDSTPGNGTTVILNIPFMKINVAIADDHKLFIDGIRSILSNQIDINIIIEASNGLELIKAVDKGPLPNVIITDIRMPVMDGISATRILTKKRPNIPILALTMFDQSADVFEMLEAGAKGFITKEADIKELIQAIKSLSNGQKYFGKNLPENFSSWFSNTPDEDDIVLTRREKEILGLIAKGRTTLQMATELKLSKFTIDTHRKNIHKKLGIKSNTGLVNYALKHLDLNY